MPFFIAPYRSRDTFVFVAHFYTFPLSVQGMSFQHLTSVCLLTLYVLVHDFSRKTLPAVFCRTSSPRRKIFFPSGLCTVISVKNSSRNASSSVASPFKNPAIVPVSLSTATRKSSVHVPPFQTYLFRTYLMWWKTDLLNLCYFLCFICPDRSKLNLSNTFAAIFLSSLYFNY